jgi:hypothetical protein
MPMPMPVGGRGHSFLRRYRALLRMYHLTSSKAIRDLPSFDVVGDEYKLATTTVSIG